MREDAWRLHRGTIDLYDRLARRPVARNYLYTVRQLSFAYEKTAYLEYLSKYIWRPYQPVPSMLLHFCHRVKTSGDVVL